MEGAPTSNIKPLIFPLKVLLYIGGAFVLVAGIQLLFLADQTEIFFAWTIKPSLTAAVLGAFYLGSMVFSFLSAREKIWAYARGGVPGVIFFTWFTLAATLLHLDRFHIDSAIVVTLIVTYAWLIVYALEPPALLLLLYLQARAPGRDPIRTALLQGWFRTLLFAHGILLLLFAGVLFIAPQRVLSVWAWSLTPLTARALSAWILSLGVVSIQAGWENDWARVRVTMLSYLVLGALNLIALGVYRRDFDWSAPGASVFIIIIVSLLGAGAYGWLNTRNIRGVKND